MKSLRGFFTSLLNPLLKLNLIGMVIGAVLLGSAAQWQVTGVAMVMMVASPHILPILVIPAGIFAFFVTKYSREGRKQKERLMAACSTLYLLAFLSIFSVGIFSLIMSRLSVEFFYLGLLWGSTCAMMPLLWWSSRDSNNMYVMVAVEAAQLGILLLCAAKVWGFLWPFWPTAFLMGLLIWVVTSLVSWHEDRAWKAATPPKQKKAIVAIHGAGMNGDVWRLLAEQLQTPMHALVLSGHSENNGNLLPTIEDMAGWVKEKLAGCAPQSIVLAGHSMGALVALEAACHPAVSGIVLLGAAPQMPVHPNLLQNAATDAGTAMDMILKWGVSNKHPDADGIKSMLKTQMQSVAGGALANDLNACNQYHNGEAVARQVQVPVLVLAGEDDKMTTAAQGKILADLLPKATYKILTGCGHMMMVEQPTETAAEINRFIQG